MKKQAINPYLPSWEYIPDGEPYVFNGRVYVYGSHDRFNGQVYCMNDYVCWSAPVDDLGDWRYEGVIYRKTQDPLNETGFSNLYAPDVTQGPDGRYYLYYCLDKFDVVSVAVCDTPAGHYEFYGYVRHADGVRLGEREGDEAQFDPGVLTENGKVYLYTGFAWIWDKSKHGAMATVLADDMITIIEEPIFIAPSASYGKGTEYEGHEFFEASSIRKVGDKYYFVYSSVVMYELCYAISDSPLGPFRYGGVLVANNDLHIDSYKPADKPMYYGANNHGGMVQIGEDWYIFYHRHTNGTNYSRQGMAEKITILPDGSIPQVEMTSCGLNGGPLKGEGIYPAYMACNLFTEEDNIYSGGAGKNGYWLDGHFPRIMQDCAEGDTDLAYIMNMEDGATCGFKYFDCKGVKSIGVEIRGYGIGVFEVRTAWDGPVIGEVPVKMANIWDWHHAQVEVPDGVNALYLTYRGTRYTALRQFALQCK